MFRFICGLDCLGLLSEVGKSSHEYEEIFLYRNNQLSASALLEVFSDIQMAESGRNVRTKQNDVVCYWKDYVYDVEGMFCHANTLALVSCLYRPPLCICQKICWPSSLRPIPNDQHTITSIFFIANDAFCKLKDILIFATGADQIPPMGFVPTPSVTFDASTRFPMANTCANVLILPLNAGDGNYSTFKEKMDTAILGSPGFGVA